MFKKLKLAMALMLGLTTSSAGAATFTYDLFDHPDGGAAAFDYGLRLDFYGRFFSFNNGSDATLIYDDVAATATITGTLRESLGNGVFGDLWTIAYSFSGLDDLAGGAFQSLNGSGSGSISLGALSLALGAASNGTNYFELDDDGHRLAGHPGFESNTFVGRGWVDPQANARGANDFLFVAEISPVPLPAGAWLLISSLFGLGILRRRQRA